MPEDYPVPGSGSNDPWNAEQQNEALKPIEPIEQIEPLEPFSAGYTGVQFSAPETPGEQQAGESGKTGAEEQTYSSTPTSEDELPPEARGETNGGPLGCCLGVTVGIVLSLSLAVFGRLYLANPLLGVLHNALLTLILLRLAMGLLALVAAILFGNIGWKIGKRLFREYEPPVLPERRPRQKQRRRKARTKPKEANTF